jgi:Ase1/PRC1/MAP65 family protein
LTIHEMELTDLMSFYENNEVIFTLYHERQGMWDRMQQLESTSNDPGRYTNRGGNLLKEERERKTISKRLPKLEAEIYELVAAYNKRHKRPFTVHGRPIDEVIQSDWERKGELKQTQLSARKKKDTTPTNLKSHQITTIKTPRTVGSNLTAGRKMTKMMASASTISVASSRYLHPGSARKAANVTRSATTLRAGDKRKLPAVPLSMAHAKRSLLKELSNSPAFLKPSKPMTRQSPSRSKPATTATLKVYDSGSATKRVSSVEYLKVDRIDEIISLPPLSVHEAVMD